MPRGGSKPGERRGGRQKGTPNKATAAKAEAIAATGETPLDFMLRLMRDPLQDYATRADMAKAAAPYVHPKLASTELKGEGGGPVHVHITGDDADL
jgi:hypothetical protein